MKFDIRTFERFVEKAYRALTNPSYELDEVLRVFVWYFDEYERVTKRIHPNIKVEQIKLIIEQMDICSYEDYEEIIHHHFMTKYQRGCDYNINHFFSGEIRLLRMYELGLV